VNRPPEPIDDEPAGCGIFIFCGVAAAGFWILLTFILWELLT
jgi:hypothetical protein